MHSYLKAVGLGEYKSKNQVRKLYEMLTIDSTVVDTLVDGDTTYVEITSEIGDGMGIKFWGTHEADGRFEIDYYFPYVDVEGVGELEEVSVEKQIDGDSYKGVCEDMRLGVSLIFHMQNSFEYRKRIANKMPLSRNCVANFVGLSCDGKVLFPVSKSEKEIRKKKVSLKNRNQLLFAARQGDEDAMESLTIEDLDTYTMINRRIQKEDVFSIVDSSFMPYGIQCDRYTLIGTIVDILTRKNTLTGDKIYIMRVECNDMELTIVINSEDLLGEPIAGRRFKGVIWLQGKLIF